MSYMGNSSYSSKDPLFPNFYDTSNIDQQPSNRDHYIFPITNFDPSNCFEFNSTSITYTLAGDSTLGSTSSHEITNASSTSEVSSFESSKILSHSPTSKSLNPPADFDNKTDESSSQTTGQTKVLKQVGAKKGKRPGRRADFDRPKKPDKSYIKLIEEAIAAHPGKRATLNEIYAYLKQHYTEFFTAKYDGWKNSIRHNLSLNQCFLKLDKTAGNTKAGKGHYWSLNPDCPTEKAQQETIRCLKTSSHPKKSKIVQQPPTKRIKHDEMMFDGHNSICLPAAPSFDHPFSSTINQITETPQLFVNEYSNCMFPTNGPVCYPNSFSNAFWPSPHPIDPNPPGLLMSISAPLDQYRSYWEPRVELAGSQSSGIGCIQTSSPQEFKQSMERHAEPNISRMEKIGEACRHSTRIPGIESIYSHDHSQSVITADGFGAYDNFGSQSSFDNAPGQIPVGFGYFEQTDQSCFGQNDEDFGSRVENVHYELVSATGVDDQQY